MKVISPSYEILTPHDPESIKNTLKIIEKAGRTCYKSEDAITDCSAGPFVSKICNTFKHESVIEHSLLTVKFICDRGVTHELVRHRLAAYSQESTRYCNYSKDKFGREITVIKPCFWDEKSKEYKIWLMGCEDAEKSYFEMMDANCSPQQARSILPNSLKTEIVMSANWREWRHVFKLRCSDKAHPQIREIMIPLRDKMIELIPEIFSIE
jgi:thymidylate synthase (FAD)